MKESTIKKHLESFLSEIKDNGFFYTKSGTKKNEIAYSQEWLTSDTPSMFNTKKWESNNIPDAITNDMIIDAACWLED